MKIAISSIFELNLSREPHDVEKHKGYHPSGLFLKNIKERLGQKGHTVKKFEKFENKEIDACIFIDFNFNHLSELLDLEKPPKSYLIVREPPCVDPRNSKKNIERYHRIFDKIFTWQEDLARSKDDIIHYKWPVDSEVDRKIDYETNNLLVNISSDKLSKHLNELYSERKKVIDYFQTEHKEEFNLFGKHWSNTPHYVDSDRWSRTKKLENLVRYPKRKSGGESGKKSPYHNHKFALCFENMTGQEGYITEKIIDCFRYGIIPIYWGATNIEEYVPENSFIDYRELSSPEALYQKISNIEKSEYKEMAKSGEEFVNSNHDFTRKRFAKTIADNIDNDSKSEFEMSKAIQNEIEKLGRIDRMYTTPEDLSLREYLSNYKESIKDEKLLLLRNPRITINALKKMIPLK